MGTVIKLNYYYDKLIYFTIHYCCITSTQYGITPLDLARRTWGNQEILEILKAQEKLEGQTK